MDNKQLLRRDVFLLKWSPLLSVVSLLWLIVSLVKGGLYVRYLIACAGLGLLYGALGILDYWRRSILAALSIVIVVLGERMARDAFIGSVQDELGWIVVSQYLSILVLSMSCSTWVFRKAIWKRYGKLNDSPNAPNR